MAINGPTTNHAEIERWAERQGALPVESLPHHVDSEPAVLRLMLAERARRQRDIRVLTWEEFFLKFDGLGLTFVYDEDDGPYYEILEAESGLGNSHPEYRSETYTN